ncbi:MAG TPA: amino acid ABC transporter permease, partial [Hyphomicrobiaceae bacterium]|nr:amino acid ABC transporter permease [Hyphomicrobiaceae bacterium]
MAVVTGDQGRARSRHAQAAFLYRPEVRQAIYQVVLVVLLVALFYMLIHNTASNLRKQNIASGFAFVDRTAGFDVSQTLIDFNSSMTYGRAFLVGLLNTLLVAGLGIVIATILGFVIGIARLSTNWLIARLAAVYVEVVRNIP